MAGLPHHPGYGAHVETRKSFCFFFTNYTKITVLSVLKWKSKVSMTAVPPVKPLPCFLQ